MAESQYHRRNSVDFLVSLHFREVAPEAPVTEETGVGQLGFADVRVDPWSCPPICAAAIPLLRHSVMPSSDLPLPPSEGEQSHFPVLRGKGGEQKLVHSILSPPYRELLVP